LQPISPVPADHMLNRLQAGSCFAAH